MDYASVNIVALLEALGTTAYGTNRMVLSIELEINRDSSAKERLDEVQKLAARCVELDIQRREAVASATRLHESGVLMSDVFQALIKQYIVNVEIVQQLTVVGRNWNDQNSKRDFLVLKSLSVQLSDLYRAMLRELKHLENPKEILNATRTEENLPRRRSAFGRWTCER